MKPDQIARAIKIAILVLLVAIPFLVIDDWSEMRLWNDYSHTGNTLTSE